VQPWTITAKGVVSRPQATDKPLWRKELRMIPYSDGIPARRFPLVNVALILANFAVFLFYELPNGDAAVSQAAFYACDVNNSCHMGPSWGIGWITAMFMHAGWDHILGNMLYLAIFGKNVEDALGRLGYLAFYLAGGFVATMMQTAMTLIFGTASDAQIPNLGASGAIAAVLGAYFVLYPNSRIHTFLLWFPIMIPAWLYLGGWFLYQFFEGNSSLFAPTGEGGSGVAFFAHVGGFIFGVLVATVLARTGLIRARQPQSAAV
jgi:membrane associated rhomboid family serine protease